MKQLFWILLLLVFALQIAEAQKKKRPKLPKSYVYIPKGEVVVDGKTQAVGDFYMFEHEISNINYFEFVFSETMEGEIPKEVADLYNPDSILWEKAVGDKELLLYHLLTEFHNYPVLGVSRKQAEAFCQYLSKLLTESFGKGKYIIEARLPTRAEWIYAARAGRTDATYSSGASLHNKKDKPLCNYWSSDDQSTALNRANTTIPVYDLKPNPWKLYNMSGNAAEMVQEDLAVGGSWHNSAEEVKIEAVMEYDGKGSPYVGFRPILIVREQKTYKKTQFKTLNS